MEEGNLIKREIKFKSIKELVEKLEISKKCNEKFCWLKLFYMIDY